jgi:dTDP-4-dehydrorhamnose reductase
MKILLLGHRGMLGNTVFKLMEQRGMPVEIFNAVITRDFLYSNYHNILQYDVIINCIGKIPQTSNDFNINFQLPIWLEELSGKYCKIIEAGSDCTFKGNIDKDRFYHLYSKMDADYPYGISKARMEKFVLMCNPQKHKIIKSSIIGFDSKNASLLSWFLSHQKGDSVMGFNNHYWNGITTLEWAEVCYNLILEWSRDIDYCQNQEFKHYIQVGTEKVSKYELLVTFNNIFKSGVIVNNVESPMPCNRCLDTIWNLGSIHDQIKRLKKFYE